MAKRIFLALVIVTLAAGGAFAQISAGVGGNLAFNFDSLKGSTSGASVDILRTTTGGGFFAFLDANYVEVDLGLLFGSQKTKSTVSYSAQSSTRELDGPKISVLTLGVYGKFPIDLGGFSIFPMLGIQYDLGLSAELNGVKREGDDLADWLNRFWVKFGVGADFNLSETLYLRPSFLYGINFGTKSLGDTIDLYKDTMSISLDSFYHGLDIRVALGFRL